MSIDRRAFIGSVGLAAAAWFAAPMRALAATARPARGGAQLVRSTFTPLLGRTVNATGAGTRAQLTLVSVRDLVGAAKASQHSYALQFSAAAELPDGIYTLVHPEFGSRQLFLSGVNRRETRRYEAIVN
ncbi:MAG: hypothetical protein JWN95_3975 [Frankiales bacterium]|nr:hypothetical protein [Frankiales bacterium]